MTRPGVNRPGACRVAAIELTRGPDKPGNSRVEVVDSGVETSVEAGAGGWLDRAAGRPRRDVDRNVDQQTVIGFRVRGKNMSLIRQRRRNHPERWVTPLEHLAVEPFPSADLVLLCGFGPDLDRTRTHQELRLALRSAGYGGSLGRHLILTSPMLRRLRGNRFALLRFTERGATR